MVTILRLSNDVVVDPVLNDGVELKVDIDLSLLERSKDDVAVLLADAHDRRVVTEGLAERAAQLARLVVVDNYGLGASRVAEERLIAEGALAALDKGDGTLDLGGEVVGRAAEVGDVDDRPAGGAAGGVGHGRGLNLLAVDLDRARGLGVQLSEGLLDDIIVPRLFQRVVEIVDGGIVAATTECAVSTVGIRNVLEDLGAREEVLNVDELLEALRVDDGLARL